MVEVLCRSGVRLVVHAGDTGAHLPVAHRHRADVDLLVIDDWAGSTLDQCRELATTTVTLYVDTLPTSKPNFQENDTSLVAMYGCESRAVGKRLRKKIDAFEMRCWRRRIQPIMWIARVSYYCITRLIRRIGDGWSDICCDMTETRRKRVLSLKHATLFTCANL